MTKINYRALTPPLLYAALLAVCLNSWLAFRAVRILVNSEYWVAHTWQVTQAAELVISSMKDAETGSRGYLLTGDPDYLEPYTRALKVLPTEIDRLDKLTPDNPSQQRRLAVVRALVSTRLNLLQQGIILRQQGKDTGVQAMVVSGTGRDEMDHLRGVISSMQSEEQRLLAVRTAQAASAQRHAYVTVSIASLLNLIFISLAIWSSARERALRELSERDADHLQRLQSISDVSLSRLSLPELTAALLERLRSVLDADASLLCTYDAGVLEIAAVNGIALPGPGPYSLPSDSLLRIAGEQQSALSLLADQIDRLSIGIPHGALQSLHVQPLIVAGRTVALLLVGRRIPAAREPFDVNLLSIIADRISIAMDRARAYESERAARQLAETNAAEVQALNEVLEQRVRERTAELEAANRELEAFSYSVSHDLRAPLRSVDGFSLALEEDFGENLSAEGRDYIQRIRKGVQRMGQLIDALLQLSRITRAELAREAFSLSELAQEIAAELAAQHPGRRLTFHIQPGLSIEADPRLLRVALENLFVNAVKFTSREPEAVIEFGQASSGEYFLRDNGAGFDMQYASKLFTAFQRLHGDKDFPGSGIGLATVARVIRRHRGHIRAESQPGQGALFSFTLG
jgi:signal transduction histidine kinase/CHASE3 domain sensor protein